MEKEVNHKHHKSAHHEKSKFSLFKHKIASVFKKIVEPPPEPVIESKEEVRDDDFRIVQFGEQEDKKAEPEEIDEDDLKAKEREDTRKMIHDHITNKLNEAVSKWKETGDVGMNLQAPVPLREKVRDLLLKMKTKSAPLSAALKAKVEDVIDKVAMRMKKAEHSGEKLNADDVVKEEWTKVLSKVESMDTSEREEIEKIYKQLSKEN